LNTNSIDVATGDDTGGEVRHFGTIGGEMAAVSRLARKLGRLHERHMRIEDEYGRLKRHR